MTIEQKAKAYDKTIERANTLLSDNQLGNAWIYKLLPELKESDESEDKKIKGAAIEFVRQNNSFNYRLGISKEEVIAWIEKQGEKPANKVEPKFHKGDWITDGNITIQIEAIKNNCYLYCGDCTLYSTKTADKVYHIWTIDDAKDGDVLACESGWTCIFKTLVNDETFSSYCFIDKTKWFCETGSECHTLNKEFMKTYNGEIKPATKEQRDVLMKAMTDAGYTFDFEKKELKKIEQKPVDKVSLDFKKGDILYEQKTMSILLVYERNGSWLMTFCDYWMLKEKLHMEFPYEKYGFVQEMSLVPATKEQSELLFMKLKEAGYEWDSEKKELRKIDWNPQLGDTFRKKGTESPIYHLCDKREDGIHFGFVEERENGAAGGEISIFSLKNEYELVERLKPIEMVIEEEFNKITELKPTWSEEEECRMNNLCHFLGEYGDQYYGYLTLQSTISWLRTLKGRIQSQPKQEWSKEDEETLDYIIDYIEKNKSKDTIYTKKTEVLEGMIVWLKSLKDRIIWKPSEQQMKALYDLNLTGGISYAGQGQVLIDLYNDLKHLKQL